MHATTDLANYDIVLYALNRKVLVQLLGHRVAGSILVKFMTRHWIANEKTEGRRDLHELGGTVGGRIGVT